MGCDLNLFIEYKSPITNEWRPFGYGYYIPRNYEMFAKMAGVRDKGSNTIFKPRGLPGDISEYVREQSEDSEKMHHDFSWLSREEFDICIKGYSASPIDIIEYKAIFASMALFEENKIETRIVFWFIL